MNLDSLSNLTGLCASIGAALQAHGLAIAKILAVFGITMRVLMAGFAVMFGQARTFSDQFFDIVIKSILIYFLVYSGSSTAPSYSLPQQWCITALNGMQAAGTNAAASILSISVANLSSSGVPSTTTSVNNSSSPPEYWIAYILNGGSNATTAPTASNSTVAGFLSAFTTTTLGSTCIFSYENIMDMIYGHDFHTDTNSTYGLGLNADYYLELIIVGIASFVVSLAGVLGVTLATIVTSLLKGSIIQGVAVGLVSVIFSGIWALISVFALVAIVFVGISTMIVVIGLCMTAVFSFVGSMVGPYLVFYVTLGFGISVVPLLYFKRFEGIWTQYLIFLISCLLCIFFYYVCAAIGFKIATTTVGTLFGSSGAVTSFFSNTSNDATLVGIIPFVGNTVGAFFADKSNVPQDWQNWISFIEGVMSTVQKFLTSYLSVGQANISPISVANVALHAVVCLGAWAAGVGVMATIVGGGIALSGIGVGFAFKWHEAFTSNDGIGKVQEMFQKIGASVHSGAGAVVNTTVGTATAGITAAVAVVTKVVGVAAKAASGGAV